MPAEQRRVEGQKAWQMALQEKNSEWLQAVEEAKKEIPPFSAALTPTQKEEAFNLQFAKIMKLVIFNFNFSYFLNFS